VVTDDFAGFMLFAFQNGKVARIPLTSYETKTKRKRLMGAYSQKSPLAGIVSAKAEITVMLTATNGKILLLDSARLTEKAVRDSIGVQVFNVKGKNVVSQLKEFKDGMIRNPHHYIPRAIPSAGYIPKEEDTIDQLTL
ncbi:MAG: topoisomerase IV, partial [Oscillospiraceae bacterium]